MALDLNNNMPTRYSNYFNDCIPVLNMKAPASGWLSAKKSYRTTKVLFMQTVNRDREPALLFICLQPGSLCMQEFS